MNASGEDYEECAEAFKDYSPNELMNEYQEECK